MPCADGRVEGESAVQIARTQGLRVWVHGTLTEPETGSLLASCEAQLVNLQPIIASKLQAAAS